MPPQKIVFVEVEAAWEKAYLKKRFSGSNVRFFKETADEVIEELKDTSILSVFIKSKLSPALLKKMPRLKFIATRSTGFDHINVKAAKKRGASVSNVPVYGENTVAEHTFALILSLSRNLRKTYARTTQNDFSIDGLMGFDLKGKTLGVVGTGHIGLHVIRMGTGFGMKVIAQDVRQQNFLSEVLNFEYVSLKELLSRSDIISLHLPYLPSTHHLINSKNIGLIKKGAILINTARGGLVNTDALITALDKGILSGAGLDVLEDEEWILDEKRLLQTPENKDHWIKLRTTQRNHILLHRQNVIYTPHLAFYSQEAVERILDTTVHNIESFIQGRPINNVS